MPRGFCFKEIVVVVVVVVAIEITVAIVTVIVATHLGIIFLHHVFKIQHIVKAAFSNIKSNT
jgi:hypothetical protein